MPVQVAPTKANLQKAKRSLRVARSGYGLLDRKRVVLLRELMSIVSEARKASTEAAKTLDAAYAALRSANITLGAECVQTVATGCDPAPDLHVLAKSVMGAWIPSVTMPSVPFHESYALGGTSAALDETVNRFTEAGIALSKAAALENSVIMLAQEIQRTQKRANALHNVLIPRYEEEVKYISESLEERDREDFFKVKQVKKKKVQAASR